MVSSLTAHARLLVALAYAFIAQLVECLFCNQMVVGSSPTECSRDRVNCLTRNKKNPSPLYCLLIGWTLKKVDAVGEESVFETD